MVVTYVRISLYVKKTQTVPLTWGVWIFHYCEKLSRAKEITSFFPIYIFSLKIKISILHKATALKSNMTRIACVEMYFSNW